MTNVNSPGPGYVESGETTFEFYMDIVLGLAFLGTAGLAVRRIWKTVFPSSPADSGGSGTAATTTTAGAETYVVQAFYSLIGVTAVSRAVWFLVPAGVWQPSYAPVAVYAFDSRHPSWIGAASSELLVTIGSLTLFSIFCLILCYWADILKKYFHPGARRASPMTTFFVIMGTLAVLEAVNIALFLLRVYTTEAMILFNAVLLAIVSVVCVVEISIFSHRFRTVLRTLGAINQVSTDSQVRRIVWITVTGNLFFFTRAFLEATFAVLLLVYWTKNGTVDKVFSHLWWDTYTLLKFGSEFTILALMLFILQSRFAAGAAASAAGGGAPASQSNAAGYQRVPQAQVV